MQKFYEMLQEIEDPRADNSTHDLAATLMISLLATICGAKNYSDMAEYGRTKQGFLSGFLPVADAVPSASTFQRIFKALESQGMRGFYEDLVSAATTPGGLGQICIDGKVLRGSHDRAAGAAPLTMVSAWSSEDGLVLGQQAVEAGSNEITAVPALIARLDLSGRIVTLDAMHTQRATCEAILAKGGDYVLRIKDNQPALFDGARAYVDGHSDGSTDSDVSVDAGHGRIETRTARVPKGIGRLRNLSWPGLAAVGRIERQREIRGVRASEDAYYAMSRQLSAAELNRAARTHWEVENKLHWRLDVQLAEDLCRARKDNAPENLAVLRHAVLAILDRDTAKRSVQTKRLKAALDESYLRSLFIR